MSERLELDGIDLTPDRRSVDRIEYVPLSVRYGNRRTRSWLVVGLFVGIGVIVAAVEAKGCER